MELLKLSKFKLQLQALITEARHLRERERLATEQIQVLVQKQKQTEEEYSRKLQELQAELTSSNESRQKLHRQVSFLQNDNALLENKQKELKETINRLLQSRESFLNAYEESTCDMKRSIETRDRKLSVLYEKINSHSTLFDSIEKEAFSIKQLVDNAERLLNRPYLQKTVSAKDIVIQNLISEKEALHLEVGSLGILLQRIHDAVANMNQEDKKVFHKTLVVKEECEMGTPNEDNRIVNVEQNSGERSPTKVSIIAAPDNRGSASPLCQEYKSCNIQLRENNNLNFCVSELACSPPESVSSEPQSASNVLSISIHDGKDNCTVPGHHLDSECSKTQAETSKDSG
ncbi:hypothetical protein Pint_23120 [Pistacia integerrima]|uniref:Uncharacterized protein n=1 Tax=Pistacia integerrima TaxID=434235 RepID=A0ACC0YK16_9ROSI|nr:hypothetical protein Pint_23120 [Pistacia integerrima]